MKIMSINIQNFLGARAVNVRPTTPVTLFVGHNYAGKSSVQEAIRMALTGESVRVALKKDYGALITNEEKIGFVEVAVEDSSYSVVLPTGKGNHRDDPSLPYVLDAQRFAMLDANERRAFLFGLMGLSASGEAVKKKLIDRGCDEHRVNMVMPILRSGFQAAHEEATARARDGKTCWRAVTGETYGEKKASTWKAIKPEFDTNIMGGLQKEIDIVNADLSAANQRLGALQADHKRHAANAQRIAELHEKSGRYSRIAEKLARDEAGLADVEATLAALKDSALSQNALPCPDCGVMLVLKDGRLVHAAPLAMGTDSDIARLPEHEKALTVMRNSVANDKRDLADSDAAARALAAIEDAEGIKPPDDKDIAAASAALGELARKQSALSVSLNAAREAERKTNLADENTKKASAAHDDVLDWLKIADALAPDGIPGEMLAEALKPLNERLLQSAKDSAWAQVVVHNDMRITSGSREYLLLSESEKWRTDAMIAEAVAHLSNMKLLVLDRFDCLDMKGREDLIAWLDILAQDGEIDTALIFGTLKALPTNMPKTCEAFWLENGATTSGTE